MKITTSSSGQRGGRLVFAALLAFATLGGAPAEPASQAALNAAVAKAKLEKKQVLLHFTGAGWCSECEDLQTEVIKTTAFKEYTAMNFVLVEVVLRADEESPLVDRYGVTGWPTLVLLDAEGREMDKVPGYRKGDGPTVVIKNVEACRTRQDP